MKLEVGACRAQYLLVLVKNKAWSPPVPSGSVKFFTSTFTSTEVPLLFDKWGSVIYGCDRIVEAFDLAPILGEISGLVCNLEAKTSQNDCFFFTQMLKSESLRSCSNGLKFGMNIGLYMGQIIG